MNRTTFENEQRKIKWNFSPILVICTFVLNNYPWHSKPGVFPKPSSASKPRQDLFSLMKLVRKQIARQSSERTKLCAVSLSFGPLLGGIEALQPHHCSGLFIYWLNLKYKRRSWKQRIASRTLPSCTDSRGVQLEIPVLERTSEVRSRGVVHTFLTGSAGLGQILQLRVDPNWKQPLSSVEKHSFLLAKTLCKLLPNPTCTSGKQTPQKTPNNNNKTPKHLKPGFQK